MIVVGLNGGSRGVIQRGIESGSLGTFRRLFREGAGGKLRGFITSPPVQWSSHLTGLPPEQTGIRGYLSRRRLYTGVGLARTEDFRVKTYPELLDEAGIRVGLVNLPPTYPPIELERGFCVSGMLTPVGADDYVHPPRLRGLFDKYRIGVRHEDMGVTPHGERIHSTPRAGLSWSLEDLQKEVKNVEERRLETALRLLDEEDPDLMVVMVADLDVLHRFAPHQLTEDPVDRSATMGLYREIDRFLAEVIDRDPSRSLLVFSGHGFGTAGEVSWFERLGRTMQSVYQRLHPEDGFGGRADLVAALRGTVGRRIPVRVKQTALYTKLYDVFQRFVGGTLAPKVEDGSPGEELVPIGVRNLEGFWVLRSARARSGHRRNVPYFDLPVLIMALMDQPVPDDWIGSLPEEILEGSMSLRRTSIDLTVQRGEPPRPNRDLQRKIEEELQGN